MKNKSSTNFREMSQNKEHLELQDEGYQKLTLGVFQRAKIRHVSYA